MISKYAVYENVVNVMCKDEKERYLILCPDDRAYGIISHCPLGCPFCEYPKKCHLMYDDHLCDTFEEVRAIIEPFYDEMFGR